MGCPVLFYLSFILDSIIAIANCIPASLPKKYFLAIKWLLHLSSSAFLAVSVLASFNVF